MFSALPAYFYFANLSFRRQQAYRAANWAGLFTNVFFLFFRASLFESIYPEGQSVSGLSVQQTLSYVCLTQAILMVVPAWGFLGVEEDIRSGQIATHLSRPINYYLSTLFRRLGESGFFVLFRTLPILVLGIWAGFLFAPASALHAFAFLLSAFLGAWIAISLSFVAEASAFWLESSRGVKILSVGFMSFFSGLGIPVSFLPEPVRQVSAFLPFEYTLNAPALIYLGAGNGVMTIVSGQLIWVALLSMLCRYLLSLGERKVIVHGG